MWTRRVHRHVRHLLRRIRSEFECQLETAGQLLPIVLVLLLFGFGLLLGWLFR